MTTDKPEKSALAPGVDRGDGRDARGLWVKGAWRGGPGRPALKPQELLFKAARMMLPAEQALVDHVELARRFSGPVMNRLIEIATDETSKPGDAIAAAELVLNRGFGLAPATMLNINAAMDALSPAEKQERVQAALKPFRELLAHGRVIEGEKS